MMMYGHSHDKFDKEYLKYCLNSIYGSGLYSNCVIQEENKRLKAENESIKAELQKLEKVKKYAFDIEFDYEMKLQEALAKQHEEMEREYKETYSMFEKRCKKYAEELAHAKADLAKASFILRNLYLLFEDSCDEDDSSPEEEKHNECQTEVQEAKEENRAARESKDTD